ncbi:hypothetical protein ACIPJK_37120 [Streptomyces roseus]|uniref:hypothetical protein n=1 Tax=Streptomyces roseus TaxID=66430 RepID=UPI00380D15C0
MDLSRKSLLADATNLNAHNERLAEHITRRHPVLDLRGELAERDEDLQAARAANRELTAQLNR